MGDPKEKTTEITGHNILVDILYEDLAKVLEKGTGKNPEETDSEFLSALEENLSRTSVRLFSNITDVVPLMSLQSKLNAKLNGDSKKFELTQESFEKASEEAIKKLGKQIKNGVTEAIAV